MKLTPGAVVAVAPQATTERVHVKLMRAFHSSMPSAATNQASLKEQSSPRAGPAGSAVIWKLEQSLGGVCVP
jgi:hypothetical protein